MKSDLDYWIALDKRKERYLKNTTEVKCKRCGKGYLGYKLTKMPLCSKCYREKFMEGLKNGAKALVKRNKAQRGGNDERHVGGRRKGSPNK